jgi:hypothetical protein
MLGLIGKGASLLYKGANALSKTPAWKSGVQGAMKGLGFAKKAAPAVAKSAATIGAGGALFGAGQGMAQRMTGYSAPTGGLPALQGFGGGMPSMSSTSMATYQGGQMMPEMLAPNTLRVFYRAPKGFVIIRDPQTRQVVGAVRKDVARRAKLWKPSKKPPISATEWQHYKDAERVEKKLRKIAASAIRKHSRPHAATCTTRKRK